MTSPLVSVVIPFFNGARFLPEAVESVFAQTYANWELLLVDDGSSDQSPAMAKGYVSAHPDKVRYVEHPGHANRGASTSRNLGAQLAKGECVAFLDADDVWLPDKLKLQVDTLKCHPEAGWTFGRGHWWYSWAGAAAPREDFVPVSWLPTDDVIPYNRLIATFLRDEDTVPASFSIMVRKQVIDRLAGGSEDGWRSVYDDQVAFAKLALASPVIVQDAVLYQYRQHDDSRCSATLAAGDYYTVRLQFLLWLRDYLPRNGGNDPEVMSELDAQFGPAYVAAGRLEDAVPYLRAAIGAGRQAALGERVSAAAQEGALLADPDSPARFIRSLQSAVGPQWKLSTSDALIHAALHAREAGDTQMARRYAWQAVREHPASFMNRHILVVILEQFLGTRIVGRLVAQRRSLSRDTPNSSPSGA